MLTQILGHWKDGGGWQGICNKKKEFRAESTRSSRWVMNTVNRLRLQMPMRMGIAILCSASYALPGLCLNMEIDCLVAGMNEIMNASREFIL